MMEYILEINPSTIILSGMGQNGCALATSAGIKYFKPINMGKPVIDTNGAGDSLAVGFLASYVLHGYSLDESVLRGQIAARHTCTLRADSQNLIDLATLDRYFIDNTPIRQT